MTIIIKLTTELKREDKALSIYIAARADDTHEKFKNAIENSIINRHDIRGAKLMSDDGNWARFFDALRMRVYGKADADADADAAVVADVDDGVDVDVLEEVGLEVA
jgi:hypothetical protein